MMIKAFIIGAALIGSTAALAQNSMDASTSGAPMSNGSMSSDPGMSNGSMSGDAMSNGSMSSGSMSNGSMSSGAMSNGSMASSGGMMANAAKCAKKYPSYDASTGMYMKNGKSMKCKLK